MSYATSSRTAAMVAAAGTKRSSTRRPTSSQAGRCRSCAGGLARGDRLLVVLREAGRALLRRELGGDAAEVEFADAVPWYQSPEHAFQEYTRYVGDRLQSG